MRRLREVIADYLETLWDWAVQLLKVSRVAVQLLWMLPQTWALRQPVKRAQPRKTPVWVN
jgi:hypothetical protein